MRKQHFSRKKYRQLLGASLSRPYPRSFAPWNPLRHSPRSPPCPSTFKLLPQPIPVSH